jgi:hypothetical protein
MAKFLMKKICNYLQQRFSTWGTRTPGGTQVVCRGYAESQQKKIQRIQTFILSQLTYGKLVKYPTKYCKKTIQCAMLF